MRRPATEAVNLPVANLQLYLDRALRVEAQLGSRERLAEN